MRISLLILITLTTSVLVQAQGPSVAFNAPREVLTPQEASAFTWTLSVTTRGATSAQAVPLPGVVCTGSAPLACSAPAPAAVVGLPYDSKVTLTAKTPGGADSPASAPFLQGTSAPSGLKVTP